MATQGEIISRIKTANKWLSDDDEISDRWIFGLAKTKASVLLKRELNARKLVNSDNVFQSYECIELILANATECGLSGQIRRSRDKLPQIEEGLYAYFIQGVFNADNSEEIHFTSIRDYINISKFKYKPAKKYFTIHNNYLWIIDQDLETVNMYANFTESIEDLDGSQCMSAYDKEFKLPHYLLDGVLELVNQSLANTSHRLLPEPEDNNKDEQR